MVKGINKQIFEVKTPWSSYFEKVILFVKDDKALTPKPILKQEADCLIAAFFEPPQPKSQFSFKAIFKIVFLSLIPFAAAGITAFLLIAK